MNSPVQSRCVLLIMSVLLIVQITLANDKPISVTPKLFDHSSTVHADSQKPLRC